MNHLALLILCALSVEIIFSLNPVRQFKSIKILSVKLRNLIFNPKISDHWKETLVPYYAVSILVRLIKLLFKTVFIFILFFLTDLVLEGFYTLVISWWGMLELTVFCILYTKLKVFLRT